MFLYFSLQHFACPALITLRKHVDKIRLHESTFSNCQQKQISHCISLQSKFSLGFFSFHRRFRSLTLKRHVGGSRSGSNGSQEDANLIGGNSCVTLAEKVQIFSLLSACSLFALVPFVVWVLLFAVAIFYAFIVN